MKMVTGRAWTVTMKVDSDEGASAAASWRRPEASPARRGRSSDTAIVCSLVLLVAVVVNVVLVVVRAISAATYASCAR